MEPKHAARAAVSLAYADLMAQLTEALHARNTAATLEERAVAADQVSVV